jgi:hypothetical protein
MMVFIPKPHREWKFGVRAFPAMYIGLPPVLVKEGILVYNPITKHVVLTRVYRVLDVLPDDWPLMSGPLQGYMPGGADSEEEFERYLADQDPDRLPYVVADASPEDDELVFQEVLAPVRPTVVPVQEVPPAAVARQEVSEPVLQRPSVRVSEPYRLVRPSQEARDQTLRAVPERIRSVIMGQILTDTKKAERKRVAEESRSSDPWVADPLFANCMHLRVTFLDATSGSTKRVHRVATPAAKKAAAKRDPDHPTKKAALAGPYRHFVQAAIDREMSQYTETFPAIHIFTYDDMQCLRALDFDFAKAMSSHMDILIKRDTVTNDFADVKARLCVHGNQDDKYDFSDIKSPTVRAATVKLLLSILAKRLPSGKTFTARTFDAKGAFLQTTIAGRNAEKLKKDANFVPEAPIVIRLPDGRYGLLLAYVYGLRQASREFQLQNNALLLGAGFLPTEDPCLFMKTVGEDYIFVSIHVDDFLSVSTSEVLHDELDALLTARYGTLKRGIGDTLTYLGMVIERTEEGHVDISGPGSTADLLSKFRSDKAPVNDYPMRASLVARVNDEEAVDATVYRTLVGGVNYYQSVFRPDLAFLVSVAASAMQSAKIKDWRVLERGLQYIEGTAGMKIRFHRDSDFRLHAWADASFQSRSLSRSQTGYCFSLGERNAMFYVKSQAQTPIAQSSTEAEYIALYHCVCEAVWLRKLMACMLLGSRGPVVVFQDNTSTIQWAAGIENFHRTKHIERKYNYSREAWADGIVEIRYCPTAEMTADILTKALIGDVYMYHRANLLGHW